MEQLIKTSRPISLLIVEDDEEFVMLLKDLLSEQKDSLLITIAETFEECANHLSKIKFDVILLDLNLPDSSGLDTLHDVLKLSDEAAIIIHSLYSEQRFITEALQIGAQDYLIKGDYTSDLLSRSIRYGMIAQQRQNDLNANQEWNRLLFENNPVPMFTIDESNGNFILVNRAARIQYNISKDALAETSFAVLEFGLENEIPYETIRDTTGEWGIRKQHGSDNKIIYADVRASRINNKGKSYILAVCTDVTERYIAEKELRESEATRQALLDHSQQGFSLLDTTGRVVVKNKVASSIWGRTFEKPVEDGALFSEFFRDAALESYLNIFNRALAGETITFNRPYPALDGKELWLEINYTPVMTKDKKVIGVCHGIRDITENMKNINRIKESEANLRASLENTVHGYGMLDVQGKVLLFNEKMRSIWSSLNNTELENGVIISEIAPPLIQNAFGKYFNLALKGEYLVGEREYTRLDGEKIWLEIAYSPVKTEEEKIIGVCIGMRDVSEKLSYQANLKKSEANLRATLDNAGEGYCLLDTEGRIMIKNAVLEETWSRIHMDEINDGAKISEMLTGWAREGFLEKFNKALNGEFVSDQIEIKDLQGDEFWIDVRFSPVVTDGKIIGVCHGLKDITEKMISEKRINQYLNDLEIANKNSEDSIKALKKTNAELDRFVYSASHELRAPITAVMGLIDISKYETDNEDMLHYFSMMSRSIQKLDCTIRDMAAHSKNSHTKVEVQQINIRAFVSNCIKNFDLSDRGINIQIDIDETVPFYSDKERLRMILQQLMSNAVKYSDIGKTQKNIFIKGSCHNGSLELSVEDNGIGIEEQYRDKVFNMFFRATNVSTGSGLGLYVVKEVIEKLNGSISVYSKFTEGSRFSISIPNVKIAEQMEA